MQTGNFPRAATSLLTGGDPALEINKYIKDKINFTYIFICYKLKLENQYKFNVVKSTTLHRSINVKFDGKSIQSLHYKELQSLHFTPDLPI